MGKTKMKWTTFWDMHSGGGQKLDWAFIFIEAPQKEAELIFQNRFGRNPKRVTCTCCGDDYSISESETLREATAFHRNCRYAYHDKNGKEVSEDEAWKSGEGLLKGYKQGYVEEQEPSKIKIRKDCNLPSSNGWGLYQSMADLIKLGAFREDFLGSKVLIIKRSEIKPSERKGSLREEGFVWKGD